MNLAKLYSTPQSGRYVNGLLDTIARHLNERGVIAKPMEERQKENNRPRARRF